MKQYDFVELELHGPADQAVAFVEGFRLATQYPGPVWYAGREGVKLDDFFDTVRQKMGKGTHVILRKTLAEQIAAALAGSAVLQVKVDSITDIDYAEMAFEFRCYSQDDGCGVRKLVEEDLPERVRVENYEVHEHIDESARGAELYSPTHDYELRGEGTFVGPVAEIIELARRLTDQDFVHPAKISLHHPT
jgi:hypothetical protein